MSNKVYFSVDGDDVGKLIERAFIENNECFIIETSAHIKYWLEQLESIVIKSGGDIIISGGDMHLSIVDEYRIDSIIFDLAKLQKSFEFTCSAAVGRSMPEVYYALIVAKSRGKNHFVNLVNEDFLPFMESKIITKDEVDK